MRAEQVSCAVWTAETRQMTAAKIITITTGSILREGFLKSEKLRNSCNYLAKRERASKFPSSITRKPEIEYYWAKKYEDTQFSGHELHIRDENGNNAASLITR